MLNLHQNKNILKKLLILSAFVYCINADAQFAVDSIQNTRIKAIINSKAQLTNGPAGAIEMPLNSGKYVLKSAGIFITGFSPLGDTVCSIGSLSDKTDFQPGPLKIGTAIPDAVDSWNWVYKLSSDEVNYHKNNYSKPGYSPVWAIANWPSNGKPGFAKVLAPYVDINNNNIYRASEGDYPYLRGSASAYMVVNDKSSIRSILNGRAGGIEAQVMYYMFSNNDPSFENAVFGKFTLHNRSANNLTLRFSVFNHFMIGDEDDNFIYTDVKNNAMVAYNGTQNDSKYGTTIPGLAVVFLNTKLASSIYFRNNNDAVVGLPENARQVLNYTKGHWKDGKALTYGSAGVDGSTPTRFVYSAGTDPSFIGNDWNEETAGSLPGKRLGLINSDSFTLLPGASKIIDVAWVVLPNVNDNISAMKQGVSALKLLYEQGRITGFQEVEKSLPVIFPNPLASGSKLKVVFPINSGKVKVVLSDLGGKIFFESFVSSGEFIILDSELKKGIYLISFSSDKLNNTQKIIIE